MRAPDEKQKSLKPLSDDATPCWRSWLRTETAFLMTAVLATIGSPKIGKRETKAAPKSDAHYAKTVAKLRPMVKRLDEMPWEIGLTVLDLREWHQRTYGAKLSFAQLAIDLGIPNVKGNYLNRLVLNAAMFMRPTDIRQAHWTWFDHDEFRRAQDRLTKGKSAKAKNRAASREEIETIFREEEPQTVRKFSAMLNERRAAEIKQQMEKRSEQYTQLRGDGGKDFYNKIHNARWEDVIGRFKDAEIDGMLADPPFNRIGAYYARREANADLGFLKTVAVECANSSPEEATATTLPLFDHAAKFAPHGFIALFQEGGLPLSPKILERADLGGWYCYRELHLVKIERDELGAMAFATPSIALVDEPIAPIEIKVAVFYKKGYLPKRIGVTDNGNMIPFVSTSRKAVGEVNAGRADKGYYHQFECPPSAVEMLLQKLLYPNTNQLIVEPFACTAPGVVVALRNGWRFVATELDPNNYLRAIVRVGDATRNVIDFSESQSAPPAQ